MSAKKNAQTSGKRRTLRTGETSKGFTAEERAAMKERAAELKAERAGKAGEAGVLAKIAEMPERERGMAERLHAVIKDTAPGLSAKTWYGMRAYAKDGKLVCFFQSAQKFKARSRPSASATRRTSTTAPCGRHRSRSRN